MRKLLTDIRVLVLAVGLTTAGGVGATTLSGAINADDAFTAYRSTSESSLGTLIASGNSWPTTYTFDVPSPVADQPYYLNIIVNDLYGPPTSFLGTFSLSDSEFAFANGTQSLTTNTTDWTVSQGIGSWTYPTGAPVSLGINGVAPWGYQGGQSSSATWLWTSTDFSTATTSWFSTKISPASPIPEPSTALLVGLGLVGVGVRRRV